MGNENNQDRLVNKHNTYKIIALMLKTGEIVQTPLYGHCMKPVINNGDKVTIIPFRLEKLTCGDIVVYQYEDRLKIHRFLGFLKKSGDKYLITKGDKSINIDPPVSPSLFLGKVTVVKKKERVLYLDSLKWKILNYLIGKLSIPLMNIKYILKVVKRKVKNIKELFNNLVLSKKHIFKSQN